MRGCIRVMYYHAVRVYQGGVLLVSHDERLIRKICTELWVCANKTVTRLDGGIEEYRAIIEKEINSS
jgi:ATP-binding cassette subfamily F protein 3